MVLIHFCALPPFSNMFCKSAEEEEEEEEDDDDDDDEHEIF